MFEGIISLGVEGVPLCNCFMRAAFTCRPTGCTTGVICGISSGGMLFLTSKSRTFDEWSLMSRLQFSKSFCLIGIAFASVVSECLQKLGIQLQLKHRKGITLILVIDNE